MAANTLNNLLILSIPEVQAIFLEVMESIVDQAMIDEMVAAIEQNDAEALYRASGFTPALLGPILDAVQEIFEKAAKATVDDWPKRIMTPAGPVRFVFDVRNPRAEQQIKDHASQFVTRISNEVRENVNVLLQEGQIRGENPRRVALDIVGRVNPTTKKREGGIIGLAQNQISWVNSARRYLEQNNEAYFTLNLRDKRFDGIVKKAIAEKKPLDQETISKLITSFKNNALRYRAEMVARTESQQAINRGENAAFVQAFDDGVLQREQVKKEWDDVSDSRVRTTHRVMGQNYGAGNGIDFDEPFVSPSGARMMFPGDTSLGAPANEVIMCRCKQRVKVDWNYGLEE